MQRSLVFSVAFAIFFIAPAATRAQDFSGVWERDDGAVYRLASSDTRVVGYRAKPSGEYGSRLSLTRRGSRLVGVASFSRRADESGFFECAVDLAIEPDGTLKGTFEAAELDDAGNIAGKVSETHVLRRTAKLAPEEAQALRAAMQGHLEADACLRAGDKYSASGKLLMARLSPSLEGTAEIEPLRAREEALAAERKAVEEAHASAQENETIAQALLVKGDFAGAKERWEAVLRATPDDESARAMIGLCEIGLKGESHVATKNAAALAKLAEDAIVFHGSANGFLVSAHLYGKALAAAPGETRYAFDRAVMLFHADRWEDARAALAEIADRDPAAKSKDGVLALTMAENLATAIQVKPRVEVLERQRDEVFERVQSYMDEEYEEVDERYKAAKRELESATKAFYDYLENG